MDGAVDTMNGVADPVETEEESKKKRKALVVIPVLAVLLAAGIATVVYTVFNLGPRQIQIPNVVGVLQVGVEAALKEQGFAMKAENVEPDDTNKGKVVDTDPKVGTQAASGSTVTLKVGAGPVQLKIPSMEDKPSDGASKALKNAGFTGQISKTDMGPAKEAADTMKDQARGTEPAAGQAAAPDQAITVRAVTDGSTVLDLTGITVDEAWLKASKLRFKTRVSVLEKENTAQVAGKVFVQDSKEGVALERKSGKITITITKAASTTVKIPSLIGMDENQATQTFGSAGLASNLRVTKVTTTDPTKPANKIYSQSVAPDMELDKNFSDVSAETTIPPQAMAPTSPFPSPSPSKIG